MLRIEKYIEEVFMQIINKIYSEKELRPIEISIATNEKFGDFQTNFAMMNSKIIGGNPRKIAENIVEAMEENEIIEKLEVAGPGFINIYLKDSYLGKYISKMTTENFDFQDLDKDGEVLIEYSSPNIAKRMHIGHLRSTIIGDSIKRIFKFLGYTTVSDNHIGDWGTQFGKLIIGYNNWLDKAAYEKNPIEELERVYVKFAQESESHPELEDQARAELKKLQDGDEENYKLWQEFIRVSLDEYNKIYKRMDISFDTYYGESFYHSIMPEVIKELEDKKIAVEDQGAKVVFFDEKENLFPCIVQKKDGAFLYSTSDIATVKYRKDNYNLNRMIYLTDERQQDHFRQFFKITEMLGWEVEKVHLWFGIMRFADGIFSTRKGNVIKLEQLLDEAKKKAFEIIEEKNPSLSIEEKENIAEVVGVGSIKYADLSQNKQSPIIFEWKKILSFDGNTAPYLQYSYARIQSILRKAEGLGKEVAKDQGIKITDKSERGLVTFLTLFPTMVQKAGENYKPNLVTDYLFELAKKFNTFYNACPILNQEDDILKSRLLIIDRVAKTLKEGLDLLGIKTVDRM
ncbi:arginine--tRNA ligase [Fusobacterium sp. IOR10]|uniref:arginine--tRNA ligase n=1 Tax=Fusobacterium sp. IOR10 TaxID=2665157 RepID=UPI0013D5B6C2|nr:arginine--tRNA ligase [Fusobacterium sp. IOR10]